MPSGCEEERGDPPSQTQKQSPSLRCRSWSRALQIDRTPTPGIAPASQSPALSESLPGCPRSD
eukprot:1830774-Rhodomonas_salina.1